MYLCIRLLLILISAFQIRGDCGEIFTNEKVIIESRNYPSNYPSNENCSYLIKGPLCSINYQLQFLDFNLEASIGCAKDRLEVQYQDALCGLKTGVKTYFVPDGTLHLKFLTDDDGFGRGFRILITRSSCIFSTTETTTVEEFPKETTTTKINTKNIFPQKDKNFGNFPESTPRLPNCCTNLYNSKRFYISSPGFPYSNNQPVDCVYQIQKANSNVCRLRIHFLFFWNGENDPYYGCSRGFLQIDGKYICGCRIGLKLISPFQSSGIKTIRFRSEGYPRSVFSGFALEIIQDECPKRFNAETTTQQTHLQFYNDQISRAAWLNSSNEGIVGKARLISENTEILDDNEYIDNKVVVRHVYVFEAPEFYQPFQPQLPKDREETTYVDTSVQSFLPKGNDDMKCRNWGILQWTLLSNEILWKQMPQCQSSIQTTKKCVELNLVRGYFQSPGYPFYYPSNLNICYRFTKLRGYCAIKMAIVDFDLENSFQCEKDYLLIGGYYRYCGKSLHNTISTFNLMNKHYEEVTFISDGYYCGRGFRGVYDQIACGDSGYPPPPTLKPPTSTQPTSKPLTPCDRVIRENIFTIQVYGQNQPSCRFDIIKSSPRVCRLTFIFMVFNLNCGSESLVINNRQYCNEITGKTFYQEFYGNSITVQYRRAFKNQEVSGLRLHMNAVQSENCNGYFPEVPAERQISINSSTKIPNNRKDICGILMKTGNSTSPETLCSILKKQENVFRCIPISENSIYVPYNNSTLKLKLKAAAKIVEANYEEIDCNNSRIKKADLLQML